MKQIVMLLVIGLTSAAFGITKTYDVVPYRGCVAQTPLGSNVTQYFRMTVDTLEVISLWVGDTVAPGIYKVVVRDSATNVVLAQTLARGAHAEKCWSWLPCTLATTYGRKPVRGKTYKATFTRTTTAPISFSYCDTNPYKFGCMSVGGTVYNQWDLACRIYGRMKACPAEYFGFNVHPLENLTPEQRALVKAGAAEAGVKMARTEIPWSWIQPVTHGQYDFRRVDSCVSFVRDTLECEMIGLLAYGTKWASTRIVWDGTHERMDTSEHCPPKNLFLPIGDSANYWARYVRAVVGRYKNRIHTWEAWNEAHSRDFWQVPNTGHYFIGPDTARAMCSLYVRLCEVTASVIRSVDITARVLVLSISVDNQGNRDWLRAFHQIATRPGGPGIFWDGVSVHPYNPGVHGSFFSPTGFEADAETVRAVIGSTREMWITEIGWPGRTGDEPERQRQARNLCEVFVTAKASELLPKSRYDRMCWYSLTDGTGGPPHGGFGLLDTSYAPKPSLYASAQASSLLVGKRFNARVMLGSPRDDSVRIYEFEDMSAQHRKTWACWVNGGYGGKTVALPVRCNSPDTVSLAYSSNAPSGPISAQLDGWLSLDLTERPKYVSETSAPARPDLKLDGLWVTPDSPVQGGQATLRARLVNHGSDSTRAGTPAFGRPNTVVRSYVNGVPIDMSEYSPSIARNETVYVEIHWTPGSLGLQLLKSTVNENQAYVEEGMDDNDGYRRVFVRQDPTGDLDLVMPGGVSSVPLAFVKTESHSWEKDSTGATPADSMRLIQEYLGQGETLALAAETTGWFSGSVTDTCLRLLFGEGFYRLSLEAKDGAGRIGPAAQDSGYPVVVFDSTGPEGAVVIDGGARFTRNPICVVTAAVADSLSGVAGMRSGRPNLVQNSGFDPAQGGWSFISGSIDTGLCMAYLLAGAEPSRVSSLIPAESISAYACSLSQLSCDLLVRVHDTDPKPGMAGMLRLVYRYVGTDSTPDTTLVPVDSVVFRPGLYAKAGTSRLATSFTLPAPAPESGQTFQAGVVSVELFPGTGRTGAAWVNNLRLEPGYVRWQRYDSMVPVLLEPVTGIRTVSFSFRDGAGCESRAIEGTIILDLTQPAAGISFPEPGAYVNDTVAILGWAYDPAGDTLESDSTSWFESYSVEYRRAGEETWQPVGAEPVYTVPVDIQQGGAGLLAEWSTAGLTDGEYELQVLVRDSAGNGASALTWVVLANQPEPETCVSLSDSIAPSCLTQAFGEVLVGTRDGRVFTFQEPDLAQTASILVMAGSSDTAQITAVFALSEDTLLVACGRSGSIIKLPKENPEAAGKLVTGLVEPSGLATDDAGNVWLCDRGANTVARHARDGTLSLTLAGPDSLGVAAPQGLAVAGQGVYVADAGNSRIAKWDTAGSCGEAVPGSLSNPQALAVTASGQMYVIDQGAIIGLDHSGRRFLRIQTRDSAPLEHLCPTADRRSLFTLKPGTNQVLKYRIQSDESMPGGPQSGGRAGLHGEPVLYQPWPNPSRSRFNIRYSLPWTSKARVRVYDIRGRAVQTLAVGEQAPGSYDLVWNLKDEHGRHVAVGVYFCRLETGEQTRTRKLVVQR